MPRFVDTGEGHVFDMGGEYSFSGHGPDEGDVHLQIPFGSVTPPIVINTGQFFYHQGLGKLLFTINGEWQFIDKD